MSNNKHTLPCQVLVFRPFYCVAALYDINIVNKLISKEWLFGMILLFKTNVDQQFCGIDSVLKINNKQQTNAWAGHERCIML